MKKIISGDLKKIAVLLCIVLTCFTFASYGQSPTDQLNSVIASMKAGDYDAVISKSTEILKSSPKLGEVYMLRGIGYYYKDQYSKAIEDFSMAIDNAIKPDSRLMAYKLRGANYLKLQKYEEAVKDFTYSINKGTDDFRDYGFRGMAYLGKGDNEAAIADFDRALEMNPKETKLNEMRGKANFNLGNYDQTVIDTTEELRLNPKSVTAYKLRADAYRKLGKNDSAAADEIKYVEMGGKMPTENKVNNVTDTSATATKDNEEDVKRLTDRIVANVKAKKYDEAIKDADELIKIYPNIQSYRLKSAVITARGANFLKEGDYQAALKDFNEAIRIDENSYVAYLGRAKANRYLGKIEAAEADEAKAEQLKPLDK